MDTYPLEIFDLNCRQCLRLSTFLDAVKDQYPDYHARPVAPFGVASPKLLIVGLAPGLHGANATGRPFTGDYAGILLYQALYKFAYSNQADVSSLADGLELYDCRISNAVKCLPPQNKPLSEEIRKCNRFLASEIAQLPENAIILALGTIAHQAVLRALGLKLNVAKFGHNIVHYLPSGNCLVDSYHCSRYNVNTGRLTTAMFEAVFQQIADLKNG